MSTTTKIAAVQTDLKFAQPDANRQMMGQKLELAAAAGARVVAFPECSVTGYCFDSRDEAVRVAETLPGPSTEYFSALCRQTGAYVVFGTLERAGDDLYNACALVGPEGYIGTYRKTHLPYLGVDRFTTPGRDPYRVWETQVGRIGMNICYDLAFPEAARSLALLGADLIVLPTNWPPGAECTAEFMVPARALENHLFYLAVNRVGTEHGFRFIGRSRICNVHGNLMAAAGDVEEVTLMAECDLQLARNKHIVRVPELHEIDRFEDRRPELYGQLVAPNPKFGSLRRSKQQGK
ncbi:MAG: carbon-nitrogen hydrolase family protein [Pirellulales bacterium]